MSTRKHPTNVGRHGLFYIVFVSCFHVLLGEKKNPIIVLITITLRLLDWFIHVEYQQLWSTILVRLP